MTEVQQAPYGTWESPITPDHFASGSVILDQLDVNRSNGKIYALEVRAAEEGRGTIVEYVDGTAKEVLPSQYNSLSQVHEYGGASFVTRHSDSHIIFTDFETKAVYDLDPSTGDVKSLVHEDRKLYYADFAVPPKDQRWVVAIQENHHTDDPAAVENKIVAIDSTTKEVRVLASGCDFYAFPRFSPDGRKLCWVQWYHPNMPWDNTQLLVSDWSDGQVSNTTIIAGADVDSSVTQPCWGADNTLYYVDDKSGFWQLYEYSNECSRHLKLSGLEDAEFCFTDFFLGAASYAPLSPGTIVSFYTKNGTYTSIVIDTRTSNYRELECPISDILTSAIKAVSSDTVAIIGSTASSPQVLTVVDISKGGFGQILKRSAGTELPEDYVSRATHITFPRVTGSGGGEAHGLFLLPKNPKYKSDGSLPPLIVSVHGGPTCQVGPGFYLRDQALTTRGYAVLQVNYVGSTGYGKKYRQLLDGRWGVSDIADAVSAVDYLAGQGLIDRHRVGLTGHSAGGFLTMQGMVRYPNVWKTAVAESGISDLKRLMEDTHKFECRYLQPLCWPEGTSEEEQRRILFERGPIHHCAKIQRPILCFNGTEDPIVPPDQANRFVETVKQRGGVAEVVLYEGEGHIFAKGSSLKDIEARRYAWFRKYLIE
ncbi:Alpha/Beta hydrolase protein [Trichoderma chlorosporum]